MCYLGPKTPRIYRKVLFPTFSSFGSKLTQQKLFLIRAEILGLLLNMLPANYELSRSNKDNLPLPIQRKLPKKRKSFCRNLFEFLLSTWNFNAVKENEPHRYIISRVIDSERWAYLNSVGGLVSEHLLEVNVLPRPKNSWNLQKSILSNFLIILIEIEWAKAIFYQISDFRTAS